MVESDNEKMARLRAMRKPHVPGVTGKREVFCHEYLKDMNASAAAVRAGYTGPNAYQLISDPDIQEHIRELNAARLQKVGVDAELVLRKLLAWLNADAINYVDEEGRPLNIHEIPHEARQAIESYVIEQVGSAKTVTKTTVKLRSAEKAAELLGKHMMLFKEVLKVEGMDELANKIIDARKRVGRTIEVEVREPDEEDDEEEIV